MKTYELTLTDYYHELEKLETYSTIITKWEFLHIGMNGKVYRVWTDSPNALIRLTNSDMTCHKITEVNSYDFTKLP